MSSFARTHPWVELPADVWHADALATAPLRVVATLVFLAFVALAFARNLDLFVARFGQFFWLVVGQNLLAMAVGYLAATAARLAEADRRALTIEVSIHNTGLGLAVLFTFFPQAGGMMLVTAFWGVWHLVAGLAVAPMQDILALGNEARMNVPGVAEGNWLWRLRELPWYACEGVRRMSETFGRA